MAGTLKTNTITRPIPVEGHLTSKGTPVEPYQYRHKVIVNKPNPITNTEKPETLSTIHTDKAELVKAGDGKGHTSSVYTVPISSDRTGYFKPKSGEKWQYENDYGMERPFRSTITDDRLGDKEVLTSKIAKELNVDGIPETIKTRIINHNEDLGEGSMQLDAQSELIKKGFSDNHIPFADAEIFDLDEWRNERLMITPEKLTHQKRQTALKNGGMDLAFLDFIIGNADRHGNNLFVGTNPKTKEQKYIGIDHGLSFPSSNKLFEPDYESTLNFWEKVVRHGFDIDCSNEFKNAIKSKDIEATIQNHLQHSSLTPEESEGVMHRLGIVRQNLQKEGKLTGNILGEIIVDHLEGVNETHRFKWFPPEPFAENVHIIQQGNTTITKKRL
jgi:hypothetical protein